MILYDYLPSGNGYKVRLLLHQLGLPFTLVQKDIRAGETRTPAFLAINPNGRIPTLVLDDGTALAESNAILWYLAEGTDYAPQDRLKRQRTLQWLFFEQYEHEPNVAVARFISMYPDMPDERRRELPQRQALGRRAIGVMENQLVSQDWLVGGRYGLADIALYAYTHVAHEGGITLDAFPAVRAWCARVAAQPRHVSITWAP